MHDSAYRGGEGTPDAKPKLTEADWGIRTAAAGLVLGLVGLVALGVYFDPFVTAGITFGLIVAVSGWCLGEHKINDLRTGSFWGPNG